MRRFVFFAVILFFVLSLAVYVGFFRGDASALMAQYRRTAPFSEQELTYRTASRPLLGDGVVLYQPAFPRLPLRLQAERMSLRLMPTETIMRLHVNVDVAGSLTDRNSADWTDSIRTHHPPTDFILKPLETLVLLNRDYLKGDLELHMRRQGKNTALTLRFEQNGRPILIVDTVVFDTPSNTLFGWTDGVIRSARVQVVGTDLLRAISGYETAVHYSVPEPLKRALETGSVYQADIRFDADYPVRNLLVK